MPIRTAVRAIIVHQNRLLLVNAYAMQDSNLWCAPGGGVEVGSSLPDNLAREVYEETGLSVSVGAPCLVNEFHDPDNNFHQVEVFFRCTLESGEIPTNWQDPEGVVNRRVWVDETELAELRFKPSSLAEHAFRPDTAISYDALEKIVG